jgi:hypothetical protein
MRAQGVVKMLNVTDSGCCLHQPRHLTFMGEEAEVMEGVFHNLPQAGGVPFYLCEHGHSHHVSFYKAPINFARLPEPASRGRARRL